MSYMIQLFSADINIIIANFLVLTADIVNYNLTLRFDFLQKFSCLVDP